MKTRFVLTHYYDSTPKHGRLVETNCSFEEAEQLVLYILSEYYTIEITNGGWGYHFSSKNMAHALKRYFGFKVISNKYPLSSKKYTIIDMYDLWDENAHRSDCVISNHKNRLGTDRLWSYLKYFYATKFWKESFDYRKRKWKERIKKTKGFQFVLSCYNSCYKIIMLIPNLIQQKRYEKAEAEMDEYWDKKIAEYEKNEGMEIQCYNDVTGEIDTIINDFPERWFWNAKISGDPRQDENITEVICMGEHGKVFTEPDYMIGAIEVLTACGDSITVAKADFYNPPKLEQPLSVQFSESVVPPTFETQHLYCPVCLRKYFEVKSNSICSAAAGALE